MIFEGIEFLLEFYNLVSQMMMIWWREKICLSLGKPASCSWTECWISCVSGEANILGRSVISRRVGWFLQRGRIACNAERCNTYSNSVCPSVCLSVCPSVTRWYPIQTNERRITRSSLWGSKNTLVFWYQQWLGGDVPFHLKFALKVTHPPLKCTDFDQYLLIAS